MWRGNQSAYNVLCNHENGKNHLHKWAKIRKYAPKNINTRKDVLYNCEMENAGAGSLQEEISRGMVKRVDRDYNALQRPLGVNKKLKIQVHRERKCQGRR